MGRTKGEEVLLNRRRSVSLDYISPKLKGLNGQNMETDIHVDESGRRESQSPTHLIKDKFYTGECRS